jgi:hypothetical protein
MSAVATKINLPYVNMYNVDVESQKTLETVHIQIGPYFYRPEIKVSFDDRSNVKSLDFFFDDLPDYELPLPVGTREKTFTAQLSSLIMLGIKSSISSFGSAFSLNKQ